ncbi:MAG: helix-turn-helix transcriptional regulator [Pseudomonadota bacterium]
MSLLSSDPLPGLAALCHQAATAPDRWPELVKAVHEAFSTSGTVLFTPEAGPADAFGVAHGAVAHGVEDYFGHWVEQDAWNVAVAGRTFFRTAGEVRLGQEFLGDAALRRTDFFNAWCQRFEAERVMSLKVEDGADTFAPVMHLSLFRRFADATFSAEEAQALKALWPHLRLAAQAHWHLRCVRQMAAQEGLDALPLAAWVLREDARIEYANRAACALMRTGSVARQRHGRLHGLGNLEADSLNALWQRSVRTGEGCAQALEIPVQGERRAALLRVMPVWQTQVYLKAWPTARLLALLETSDAASDVVWMDALVKRYALTRAEREVLEHLRDGLSQKEIAALRGVTVGTVSTQVNLLFSKTGLHRQPDLMRLALGRWPGEADSGAPKI